MVYRGLRGLGGFKKKGDYRGGGERLQEQELYRKKKFQTGDESNWKLGNE